LRAGEVVEGEVVFEDFADFDDIFAGGGLAGGADFAEEFLELFFFGAYSTDWKSCFTESVTEEGGDLLAGVAELGGFVFAGFLAFVCGGEHVREELECNGEEELGEGNDDKDREGDEAAKILDSPL